MNEPDETLRERLLRDLERAESAGDFLETGVHPWEPARDRRELMEQIDAQITYLDRLLEDNDVHDALELARLERAREGWERVGRDDMARTYTDALSRRIEAQQERRGRLRQERQRLLMVRYVGLSEQA